jgi:hypothetical protein
VHARLGQIAIETQEPELLELAPKLGAWQRWFLIHALELLPGTALIFRFRTVLLLVARQNGKTTVLVYLILWRMFTDGSRLVIGTAQSLDIAEETWAVVVQIAEAIPELEGEIKRVNKTNGKQALVLENRERYKIAAASRRGGRSLTGDLVVLDELREHQSWDSWAAVSKTTMARSRAQVYGVSNAGDAASIVLRHLRDVAKAAIDGVALGVEEREDVEDESIGLFEFSAREGRGIWDRAGWVEANPMLGRTITEAAIASAAHTDPERVFRTEVLCQPWDGAADGPFIEGTWEAGIARILPGEALPGILGKVRACVDVSFDRAWAHVAFAGINDRGRPQVEIVASRAGLDWVLPWLQDPKRAALIDAVTGQTRGAPVSGLMQLLAAAGVPVVDWQGPDLGAGSGTFYDLVSRNGLDHLPQPVLDVAAATAVTKPSGDGWLWDRRKSPTDIAPLVAGTGAVWLLTRPTPPPDTPPAPPMHRSTGKRGRSETAGLARAAF